MQNKTLSLSSTTIFAAATIFLYSSSSAYMGGYLGTLKLDADVLDRNFHQVLYSGFLISFESLLRVVAGCALASFFYSHLVLPLLTDFLRKGVKQRRWAVRVRRFFRLNNRPDTRVEKIVKHRTRWASAVAALLLLSILALAHYEQKGKAAALVIMQRFVDQAPAQGMEPSEQVSVGTVRVKIDDQVHTLVHLMCGARNCAGWDRSEKLVYYYPQAGHAYPFAAEPSAARR